MPNVLDFSPELWTGYVRPLLETLEGAGYPTYKEHPEAGTYGPLGIREITFREVKRRFPEAFKDVEFKDVLRNPTLYDLVGRAYADIIFDKYLKEKYDWRRLHPAQVMAIIGRAWRGPIAYKKGKLSLNQPRIKKIKTIIRKKFPKYPIENLIWRY